ncbi:MAG: sulfatase-like hydrolase/transferase [Alistipes sp.]|nr:sulfatase-like hydrolase/transferase [Alistipes sp.]
MKIFKTHLALLIWRIILLYVVLMLCRLLFYAYNSTLIGEIPFSEWWSLVCGSLKFDTVSILYANALFIILSLIPLRVRESRWWRRVKAWYYVVVNAVLIVVANLADTIYFHYTQKRFTADEIFFADNDNSLQLVLKFAAENWYIVLFGIAFIIMLAAGYWRKTREWSMLNGVWYYLGSAVVFVAALGLCVGGVRGGFTKMTRPITMSNATLYTADNMRATMILSNPFCILRTIGSSGKISYQKYFSEEELHSIYSPEHHPALTEEATELEGRNVVVFVMESFSAEHSALLRPDLYADKGQKGYTPFMDSLMRQSYTFYNMYANGRRSIQALPAVWASIPSYKNPFVLMPQSMAETRALPAILRDKGYRTMFFCGSDHGSMGFGAFARTTGIEHLYSRQDYEARHGKGDFDGYWGIWDEKFIDYMGEELQQSQSPFFATIFTLTSHHPFVIPEEYEGKFPEGLTPNHKCVGYVDNAVGRFFEKYGEEEWFQNTIFVFVADHVSSEQFSDVFRTSPGSYQVMGFIHAPNSSLVGEHRQVVSQVDIMPTLLGLLGNDEPYFAFGRDIFGEHEAEPISVSYDNNMFQAITAQHLILFDENQVVAVYALDDIRHEHNLKDEIDTSSIERRLKANIQSYYSHIETKNYIVE